VMGKGLSADDPSGFVWEVVALAVRAGLVAGLAIGGALLSPITRQRGDGDESPRSRRSAVPVAARM
jgi:hypothetical protein